MEKRDFWEKLSQAEEIFGENFTGVLLYIKKDIIYIKETLDFWRKKSIIENVEIPMETVQKRGK
ncbi:MAG: hypothetical protein Q4E67_05950 [Planctomycetia bacterium]|nr:hypothetical protein [Planctomycetia bacterium]